MERPWLVNITTNSFLPLNPNLPGVKISMSDHEYIHTKVKSGVLIITLDDSATRNALGPEMCKQLVDRLDLFEETSEERVLVITGTEPSFCSGANVGSFRQRIIDKESLSSQNGSLPWGVMDAKLGQRNQASRYDVPQVVLRMFNLQKPSIAAINGHAIGAGMGLALACDIRIASEKSEFSEAFVSRGLIPADGSCWQLPRLIGSSNTFLLQYTGDRISAAEAHSMGIVSKIYDDQEMMDKSIDLACRIAQGPSQSHSITKYLIQQGMHSNFSDHLDVARIAQDHMRQTEDHKEAVQAFLEKRKPIFKNQ